MPRNAQIAGCAFALFGLLPASALAQDLYYTAPGTDDWSAVLFDRSRSFDLARCFGRYDAAITSGPLRAAAKSARADAGRTLIAAALADRGVTLSIKQFVPVSWDEDGVQVNTGAPEDLYDAYLRGLNDAKGDTAGGQLTSCDVLLSDLHANRNTGAPKEPLYQRKESAAPIVLALAACYGQYRFVRTGLNSSNNPDAFDPKDYPDGFADDGKAIAAALTKAAKRDRDATIDLEKRDNLPAAVKDEYAWAYYNTDTGRPDFTEVLGEAYSSYMRADCQMVLDAANKL